MKPSSLSKRKPAYLIHIWWDRAFKGAIVNRALPSLPGGSLEILLTVTLNTQTEVTLITQYLRILEIVESVNKKEIIDSPINTAAMKKKKIEWVIK